MKQTIEAIYEDGIFRPLDPASLNIPNGQRVQMVVVRDDEDPDDEDPLELTTSVYDGLSEAAIDEIEKMALDRSPGRPDILKLAAKVYEGLTVDEIAEVERMALTRSPSRSGN